MGRDKALLPYGDSTFLAHLVALFLARLQPVMVVLGHHAERIRRALPSSPGLEVVINENYRAGQFSSLQAGLRALPPETAAAMVTLVDHPAVAGATLDALLERCAAGQPPLLIPRHDGRRGHPVIFSRLLIDEILALAPEASAKQVVHAHLGEAVLLDTGDPGVLRDIDTPEDYAPLSGGLKPSGANLRR